MIGAAVTDVHPLAALRHALHGHAELIAEITNHVEEDRARRDTQRAQAARGSL